MCGNCGHLKISHEGDDHAGRCLHETFSLEGIAICDCLTYEAPTEEQKLRHTITRGEALKETLIRLMLFEGAATVRDMLIQLRKGLPPGHSENAEASP